MALLYLNVLSCKCKFTRGPNRSRPSAPQLYEWTSCVAICTRQLHCVGRKNALHAIYLGVLLELSAKHFVTRIRFMGPPYVVTLQELVLLLWETKQADGSELLNEIRTRIEMYIHWPAVHTLVSVCSIYFRLLPVSMLLKERLVSPRDQAGPSLLCEWLWFLAPIVVLVVEWGMEILVSDQLKYTNS